MKCDNRSVDEVIENLPRNEAAVVTRLRALILESLPKAAEQNSYGVPFYRHHRMICFIWPPSVTWGGEKKKVETRGVTLGFCRGNLFANEDGSLLSEGRKQVYCMYFDSVAAIDEAKVRSLLYEAEMIDDAFAKRKKVKRVR